jgi:hypothetical protein
VLRDGERNSQNPYFENQIWSMDRKQCGGGDALIETCTMSHCHDDSNEMFQRGLSFRVQESIREITKFNIKIRRRTLHRSLLMDPYNFSGEDVPISKVASYLHRIRACASSSYMEYSVLGLCAMIEARQRCESSNNTSKFFS